MSLLIWPSGPSTPPDRPEWMDDLDVYAEREADHESFDQHYGAEIEDVDA